MPKQACWIVLDVSISRPGEKIEDGSWMLGNKTLCGIREILPLTTLVYNFEAPLYGKPSLLSFSEMYTLFGKVRNTFLIV
jgi:Zn-dependent oligopeptidase